MKLKKCHSYCFSTKETSELCNYIFIYFVPVSLIFLWNLIWLCSQRNLISTLLLILHSFYLNYIVNVNIPKVRNIICFIKLFMLCEHYIFYFLYVIWYRNFCGDIVNLECLIFISNVGTLKCVDGITRYQRGSKLICRS